MSYDDVPAVLRCLDKSQTSEAIPTQLAWVCLAYLPSLATLLRLPAELTWWRGRHGEGDVTGRIDDDTVAVHFEVKGAEAEASYGSRCPRRCGQRRSQFTHMGENPDATIMIVCQSSRVPAVWAMARDAGVLLRVRVITLADLADAVEEALRRDGSPRHGLLWALCDAEDEYPGDAA
jgi:hypothetical protein